ncbi:hypothetical protein SAY86_022675 [Trapa natans]|uniref:F-box domain-containing protein n=1 Tax=Trapa natans TaxID=22666 RepID=A0AAN7LTX0_TRANT|nr:hypothetical protein SAY86_022675 [Trapa natans]
MAIPMACICEIIALTSPRDACRFSAVSNLFKEIADSDLVWNRFLPPDIDDVLARAAADLPQFASRKQLYFSLCNRPILIDGGRTSFWLARSSGRKCYMLSPRSLMIAWGENQNYWRWGAAPRGSRFPEVAELIRVCWFDIKGRIDIRSLSTPLASYSAYLVFRFTEESFGFRNLPVEVTVGPVDREAAVRTDFLNSDGMEGRPHPVERRDGWLETRLGGFSEEEDHYDGVEMELRVSEVRELNWKSGLIVQGIEIRPAEA